MKHITTVIFDLDGTLIDTEPAAAQAVKGCFNEWKISIDPSDSTYVTGRTWESAFTFLFQKYSIPIAKEAAKEKIMDHYRNSLENNLQVVPGSVQAVRSLASHFNLGLVSGSGRAEILWALRKLEIEKHFQVILGAEDYPRSKPQPDGYLKAIDILQASASSCLIFEDSSAGIASARASGAWVAAITSTNHFKQDLTLAHFKIPDLNGVTSEWVKNLSFD